ncbi:Fe-S oxidoreductase [Spirochaetia bacterium]|nr:Fe-S oxidoreductase [Spirochaetia bacterium]
MTEAESIRNKALELGYENCGIIPIAEVDDYTEKLDERVKRFPETKEKTENLYNFANLTKRFPWAASIVICISRYGKYHILPHLQGRIAKYYLTDSRTDEASPDYQASLAFEAYLNRIGLQTATERKFGITALRWAAIKTGLGTVRRNNFFYTPKGGSWVHMEAWLIDRELELKHRDTQKPCPKNCSLCIKACPTASLAEPYAMNRLSCVSSLTTWDGWDMPNEPHNKEIGGWIFGCDACQDACPFNNGKWVEDESFPGLDELGERISLEQIIEMDYGFLENVMAKKFWYVGKEKAYRWKINALNAMRNGYQERYAAYIEKACGDPNAEVRRMAEWVKGETER